MVHWMKVKNCVFQKLKWENIRPRKYLHFHYVFEEENNLSAGKFSHA